MLTCSVFSVFGQNSKTKGNNLNIQSDDSSNSVKINLNGEEFNISKSKLDSIYSVALKSFQTMLNDKDNQKQFKESIDKIGIKMEKLVEVLVDNPEQKNRVKKELKASIKEAKPLVDSVVKKLTITFN